MSGENLPEYRCVLPLHYLAEARVGIEPTYQSPKDEVTRRYHCPTILMFNVVEENDKSVFITRSISYLTATEVFMAQVKEDVKWQFR